LLYLEKVLAIQDDNIEALMLKGKIMEKSGKTEEAIKTFELAVEI
jgi:cytochrome c-type biogenesis protein CcmH/NrfG